MGPRLDTLGADRMNIISLTDELAMGDRLQKS